MTRFILPDAANSSRRLTDARISADSSRRSSALLTTLRMAMSSQRILAVSSDGSWTAHHSLARPVPHPSPAGLRIFALAQIAASFCAHALVMPWKALFRSRGVTSTFLPTFPVQTRYNCTHILIYSWNNHSIMMDGGQRLFVVVSQIFRSGTISKKQGCAQCYFSYGQVPAL
jgi:hypothetical protein